MKKFLFLLVIVSLVTTGIFAGGGSQSPAAGGQGGATGKIMIYTSIYEDVIEALDKVLEKQFPGCKIEFFYGGTGRQQTWLRYAAGSGTFIFTGTEGNRNASSLRFKGSDFTGL